MASSSYWLGWREHYNEIWYDCDGKIKKYNYVKDEVNALLTKFDTVISNLSKAKSYIDEGVIINGKSFDKDKINEYTSDLTVIKEECVSLVNECSNKIDSLEKDKDEANTNYWNADAYYWAAVEREKNGG